MDIIDQGILLKDSYLTPYVLKLIKPGGNLELKCRIFVVILKAYDPYLNLQMLPLNTNIRLAYSNGKDDEQNFIQNLSLFLCTFLKEHGQLIEKRLNLRETLMEVGFVELLASKINYNVNCFCSKILLTFSLTYLILCTIQYMLSILNSSQKPSVLISLFYSMSDQ